MKSCSSNDVKIYNLSAGKSVPEWLSAKKRKKLSKSVEMRRRVELIQDFEMPSLSSNIQLSPDGNFLLATGVYKPRVRCYDLKNLSMKFERCFDSDVLKFIILSEDYSKLVFLQSDRYVEFHAQFGRYFRLRIPSFGRDLAYSPPSADLLICGTSPSLYRLNLELGQFMSPLVTECSTINRVVVNREHGLVVVGSEEGGVEGWDLREGKKVGELGVGGHVLSYDGYCGGSSVGVTCLNYKDSMTLGVGTSSGQVLLYDIRSPHPLLIKDHYYSLPITNIEFRKEEELVLSMDSKIVKIWNETTGEPYTAVEAEPDFNDLCLVPNSGMFFIANEDKKILTYYIPSMGPAPKWCSFVDNLTEELEETPIETLYDDYKFVTEAELGDIGLNHLIGSNLLRAHMHGYFIDMRLYRKAKGAAQPFEYGEFKKRKIREKLEEQRANRVKIHNLPKVNRELALKLMSSESDKNKKKVGNLMEDDRFGSIFTNPDFEVDKTTEEYRLLNPALTKLDKKKTKKLETLFTPVTPLLSDDEAKNSSDDLESSSSDESDSYYTNDKSRKIKEKRERDSSAKIEPKFYEIRPGEEFKHSSLFSSHEVKSSKKSLGERVGNESGAEIKMRGPLGSREMSFQMKSRKRDTRAEAQKHHEERRKIRRSAGGLKSKKSSWKK